MPRGRRGNGEGSIFQRESDGRWIARLFEGYDPEGKPKYTHFTGRRREDVRERLLQAQARNRQGLPSAPERTTVGAFLERWLEDVVKVSRRPQTYAMYEMHVRVHLAPGLGRVQLQDVTPEQVQRVLNHWQRKGLSPQSVRAIRSVLRTALGQAMKWGLVHRNVASLSEAPRLPRSEITPFTPEQAARFVEHLEQTKEPMGPLFVTVLALGLRIGEALSLQWEDVDLQRGMVQIRSTLARVDGKLQRTEPKTESGRRTLALGELATHALRTQRARQRIAQARAGYRWQHTPYVFTSRWGTPHATPNVRRIFARVLREADLPKIRLHDLRHSAASLMLARGATIKEVSEQLGHSGISITADLYGHWYEDQKRRVASIMDSVLGGQAANLSNQ